MGKSKGGGGGGGHATMIGIPPALNSSGPSSLLANVFEPIGTYGSEMWGGLDSLANWAANIATGGNVLGAQGTLPQNGLLSGGTGKLYSPFTSGSQSGTLGPFLSQFQQGLTGLEAGTITGQNLLNSGVGEANKLTQAGNTELNMATRGTGLFPSQQAMVNQAEASQQAAVQQQLSSEGLGSSTVSQQLQGQVKMSAAAAAGQLVQGNIQAAQNTLNLAQGQEKINLAAQEALTSQFQTISQLSGAEQQTMWAEAQQGYGTLGQMMNTTLGSFGYAMQTQQDVLQANTAEAQIQAGQQAQMAQMAQQGASSMFGALGSLLGSGGSGGGFLGGISGLLSGGGSAAAAGLTGGDIGTLSGILGSAAGGGGAAAGGIGGLLGSIGSGAGGAISAIGSALGALFCEVARTVYGLDSEDWLLFRNWILFRAPKPVRTAYVIHAYRVSRWIKGRKTVCSLIRWLMNTILYVDSLMP